MSQNLESVERTGVRKPNPAGDVPNAPTATVLACMSRVLDVLSGAKIRWASERNMQDDIEAALKAAGIKYDRELPLTCRHRIDFRLLFDVHESEGSYRIRVGIECKTQGGPSDTLIQCNRYAEQPELDALILVTSKASHRRLQKLEHEGLAGKPFALHFVPLPAGVSHRPAQVAEQKTAKHLSKQQAANFNTPPQPHIPRGLQGPRRFGR